MPLAGGQPIEPLLAATWWLLAVATLLPIARREWQRPRGSSLLAVVLAPWIGLGFIGLVGAAVASSTPRGVSLAPPIALGGILVLGLAGLAHWALRSSPPR